MGVETAEDPVMQASAVGTVPPLVQPPSLTLLRQLLDHLQELLCGLRKGLL
jgi:hypothetical protein